MCTRWTFLRPESLAGNATKAEDATIGGLIGHEPYRRKRIDLAYKSDRRALGEKLRTPIVPPVRRTKDLSEFTDELLLGL